MYADDTQLYRSSDITEVNSLIESTKNCIVDVSAWMKSNKLKLNEDKTEILVVGTPVKVKMVGNQSIDLSGETVAISSVVRNLGVQLNAHLSIDNHVSYLRKVCYLELRRISQIRQYLTEEASNKLVCSFILSRLDYCNSLLAGAPDIQLTKLQQIQNNAARLIKKVSKKEHITPILNELHWLPVRRRVNYKIASIAFQCQNDEQFPNYLRNLVKPYTPARYLRSQNSTTLIKPKTKLKTYGQRALTYQSADIWNNLPNSIQNAVSLECFKAKLKTYLFSSQC